MSNDKSTIVINIPTVLKNRIDELVKQKESNRSQVTREAIKIGLALMEVTK